MNPSMRLARPDILRLDPYAHAEWDPRFERLHANESPWRFEGDVSLAGLNRYPEPYAHALEARLAALYGVHRSHLVVARGSDECIDLLVRAFCTAGRDAVLICPPTFGMYAFASRLQGASIVEVPLLRSAGFALNVPAIERALTSPIKLLFFCSPGNPTGAELDRQAIHRIAHKALGRALVVVDEAYGEFSSSPSLTPALADSPNVVILRTLSKAWALAGARCGVAIGAHSIMSVLRRVLPPYALPTPTQEAVWAATEPNARAQTQKRIAALIGERARLMTRFSDLPSITRVYPSEANFILVESDDAPQLLERAARAGLLLRDVSRSPFTPGCVRITVGAPEQNDRLLAALAPQ